MGREELNSYSAPTCAYLWGKGAGDAASSVVRDAICAILKMPSDKHTLPYLIKVAHNIWISRLRRQRAHLRALSALPAVGDYSSSPLSQLIAEEEYEMLVNKLTDKQLKVLVLRHVESRSYQEIADILGVSIGAASGLVTRANQKARKVLSEDE